MRWAGRVSEPFNVSNGVRQGGVLSPFLFNACIDGLLGNLRESAFGARLSGYHVGCITYADDITLISPTVHGLQSMLSICERFVKENMLKFNLKKSMIAVFCNGSTRASPEFHLDGQRLSTTDSVLHLENMFNSDRNDNFSVERRLRKLFAATNAVLGKLGGACKEEKTWRTVLDKQLFPVLAYGNHLWCFEKKCTCHAVNTAWRKVIRKGFGMNSRDSVCERCATWFVEASEKMKREQLLFCHRSLHSLNELVQNVAWSYHLWKSTRRRYTSFSLCTMNYKDLKKCTLI